MFFVTPGDVPPEVQAAMDRQRMSQEAFYHDLERLFSELKQDQLETLRTLVGLFSNDDTAMTVGYATGRISSELLHRFNICAGCHKDHDKAAEAAVGQGPEAASQGDPLSVKTTRPVEPTLIDASGAINPEAVSDEELDQARIASLFMDYGLQPDVAADEPLSDQSPGICKCGLRYISLSDRMLRPVDECHGCQHRQGHG